MFVISLGYKQRNIQIHKLSGYLNLILFNSYSTKFKTVLLKNVSLLIFFLIIVQNVKIKPKVKTLNLL